MHPHYLSVLLVMRVTGIPKTLKTLKDDLLDEETCLASEEWSRHQDVHRSDSYMNNT